MTHAVRPLASLAAVFTISFATLALADSGDPLDQYIPSDLAFCPYWPGGCGGPSGVVSVPDSMPGDPVDVYIDYDWLLDPGYEDECAIRFEFEFDSTILRFDDGRTVLVGGESESIVCGEFGLGLYTNPPYCPGCDRRVSCRWKAAPFAMLHSEERAELRMEFTAISSGVGQIVPRPYLPYGYSDTGECDHPWAGFQSPMPFAGPQVMATVPEPGFGAMLASSVPLLAWFARRRSSR